MGIDQNFPMAYAKAQIAAGSVLPTRGPSHFRAGRRQAGGGPVAKMLADAGFN